MKRPAQVIILGLPYTIAYVDNPAEVDIHQRKSLWGQIDYWTRTIRIYDKNLRPEILWQVIWHEIIHGIVGELHLEWPKESEHEKEDADVDRLATAISDILIRNGWLAAEWLKEA